MSKLTLHGKTFHLKSWTLSQAEMIEERLGISLVDFRGRIREVKVAFLVSVRGQHGLETLGDVEAYVKDFADVRAVDRALAPLLTEAIKQRYALAEALAAEPEGNSPLDPEG